MRVTDDLRDWIEEQALVVLNSNKALENFGGQRYQHVEVAYGAEGFGRDGELVGRVMEFLQPYLPSDVLFWRVVPEIQRVPAYAPEDIDFITGEAYGKYVPPQTKIYLRLSLDNLREGE